MRAMTCDGRYVELVVGGLYGRWVLQHIEKCPPLIDEQPHDMVDIVTAYYRFTFSCEGTTIHIENDQEPQPIMVACTDSDGRLYALPKELLFFALKSTTFD